MRRIVNLLAVIFIGILLSGCTVNGRQVVFTFGGGAFSIFKMGPLRCPDNEVRVYLANYKNIYGRVGETDLWNGGFDVDRMEESIRMLSAQHLARVYSMNLYATDHDIALDEKELTQVKTAAAAYYNSLSAGERAYMQVSENDIEQLYRRYATAQKVYAGLMDSIDEEISEDEARVMDAYVLFVAGEEAAASVEEAIARGDSFEKLCASYSRKDKGKVSFGRGTYPKAVEEAAFDLDDGEISGRIADEYGYYFVCCINKYNRALSEQNKDDIVGVRKEQAINEIISSQSRDYYSVFNEAHLDAIPFDGSEAITTDSFFSTIESYLPR
ncbi:MAG: peptidyl-prolyl cis-trans isomerase [Lachnospiraceae bacterium]|nr:peptidyl-prolyl cis-trans isomerase [Lachnospiraceae bacterium]